MDIDAKEGYYSVVWKVAKTPSNCWAVVSKVLSKKHEKESDAHRALRRHYEKYLSGIAPVQELEQVITQDSQILSVWFLNNKLSLGDLRQVMEDHAELRSYSELQTIALYHEESV